MEASAEDARNLEFYLDRDLQAEKIREGSLFDAQAGRPDRQLVLYGAGELGKVVLAGLRNEGIKIAAFSDGNEQLWGRTIDGVRVLPPKDAAQQYGEHAAFVVTIFNSQHSFPQTQDRLMNLGCHRVLSCLALFYRFPDRFLPYWAVDLPHKLVEKGDRLGGVYSLLADVESRQEFLRELQWRMELDFDPSPSRSIQEQYFPEDLLTIQAGEVFVDCGAFRGDTLSEFLARSGGRFQRYLAFEPDPSNFKLLRTFVGQLPLALRKKVEIHRQAIGTDFAQLMFQSTGDISSRLDLSGQLEVSAIPLDSLLGRLEPTIVKMDIEGGELDALEGARQLIRKVAPLMAVCVYHRPDHFWAVPERLAQLHPEYSLYLRRYAEVPWELVCYAVPKHGR
jgi:FkbM family methyltransferase